jgi:hypothetical protein
MHRVKNIDLKNFPKQKYIAIFKFHMNFSIFTLKKEIQKTKSHNEYIPKSKTFEFFAFQMVFSEKKKKRNAIFSFQVFFLKRKENSFQNLK